MEVRSFSFRRGLLLLCGMGCAATLAAAVQQTAPSTPPASASDKSRANPGPRPARVMTDLSGFHLDRLPAAKTEAGLASRGAVSQVTLCAPSDGISMSTHPRFEWHAAEQDGVRYTFSLLNDAGDVLVEMDVPGFSLDYPADSPPLEPGQGYAWKVSGSSLEKLPNPVHFTIASKAAQAAVEPQLADRANADPLLRAQVFVRQGLWYDAVAALQAGLRQHPDRTDLAEQLDVLYRTVAPGCAATQH
jgi:hypothetical protein